MKTNAIRSKLVYYKGTDDQYSMVIKDYTVDNTGVPVDITGATITLKVRETLNGTDVLSKTVGTGITLTDAVNGEFTLTLSPSDVITPKDAAYIVTAKMVLATKTYYIVSGTLKVNDTGF